jgi:hypothetical protein
VFTGLFHVGNQPHNPLLVGLGHHGRLIEPALARAVLVVRIWLCIAKRRTILPEAVRRKRFFALDLFFNLGMTFDTPD